MSGPAKFSALDGLSHPPPTAPRSMLNGGRFSHHVQPGSVPQRGDSPSLAKRARPSQYSPSSWPPPSPLHQDHGYMTSNGMHHPHSPRHNVLTTPLPSSHHNSAFSSRVAGRERCSRATTKPPRHLSPHEMKHFSQPIFGHGSSNANSQQRSSIYEDHESQFSMLLRRDDICHTDDIASNGHGTNQVINQRDTKISFTFKSSKSLGFAQKAEISDKLSNFGPHRSKDNHRTRMETTGDQPEHERIRARDHHRSPEQYIGLDEGSLASASHEPRGHDRHADYRRHDEKIRRESKHRQHLRRDSDHDVDPKYEREYYAQHERAKELSRQKKREREWELDRERRQARERPRERTKDREKARERERYSKLEDGFDQNRHRDRGRHDYDRQSRETQVEKHSDKAKFSSRNHDHDRARDHEIEHACEHERGRHRGRNRDRDRDRDRERDRDRDRDRNLGRDHGRVCDQSRVSDEYQKARGRDRGHEPARGRSDDRDCHDSRGKHNGKRLRSDRSRSQLGYEQTQYRERDGVRYDEMDLSYRRDPSPDEQSPIHRNTPRAGSRNDGRQYDSLRCESPMVKLSGPRKELSGKPPPTAPRYPAAEWDKHSKPTRRVYKPPSRSPSPRPAKKRKVERALVRRLKPKLMLNEELASSKTVYHRKPDEQSVVGFGTYGKVFKAQHVYTGAIVALKKIRAESERDGFPTTSVREIQLLQSLKHDNVVNLHEMMFDSNSFFMVFEYLAHDLCGLLKHPTFRLTEQHRKDLALQMFRGLDFLHGRGVLHRDIKAANILVSSHGVLKIADFGLARRFAKHEQLEYTNRVITIWYRPPELLLGETRYGPEVDMWSAACVLAEIYLIEPIFQGPGSDWEQLTSVFDVLGTPTTESWPGVLGLPWTYLLCPKHRIESTFAQRFKHRLSTQCFNLLQELFTFDPKRRPTAAAVLEHPFFIHEEPAPMQAFELAELARDWHEFDAKKAKREAQKAEREAQKVETTKQTSSKQALVNVSQRHMRHMAKPKTATHAITAGSTDALEADNKAY